MTVNNRSKSNLLSLKVTPNAGRNEVTGFTDGVLHVKINAPPVKGKANRELIDFLSRVFDVKKSAITIVKGQTSRNKTIAVEGMSQEDILKKIIH